jgi:hypothetical protein
LLTAIPIAEVERIVRRTAISAIVVCTILAGLAMLLGQPYFVPGLAVGLVLAIANHRVFQSSALRFTTPEGELHRKTFAGSVALRLGGCTVVAIGLLILNQPVGWGVVTALVVFQLSMMGATIVSLLRLQRRGAALEEPTDD